MRKRQPVLPFDPSDPPPQPVRLYPPPAPPPIPVGAVPRLQLLAHTVQHSPSILTDSARATFLGLIELALSDLGASTGKAA